jgi:hypothetical protein
MANVAEAPVFAKSVERPGVNRSECRDPLHHRLALPDRKSAIAAAPAIALAALERPRS